MNRIEHIIWDFNGTLLDDVDLCIETMNVLLLKRNLPLLQRSRYQDIFQFPVINYYRELGFDFNLDPFSQLAQEYLAPYNQNVRSCELYEGVESTLAKFQQAGVKQYILSAFEHDELVDVLKHLNILHYFNDVAGLDNQHAASKTAQGHQLIERNAIEPNSTLIIGDTHHDFDVAGELNVQCLLIDHGHQSRQKLNLLTTNVVSQFDQIQPHIDALSCNEPIV